MIWTQVELQSTNWPKYVLFALHIVWQLDCRCMEFHYMHEQLGHCAQKLNCGSHIKISELLCAVAAATAVWAVTPVTDIRSATTDASKCMTIEITRHTVFLSGQVYYLWLHSLLVTRGAKQLSIFRLSNFIHHHATNLLQCTKVE